jgi:two-component system OmpR family response regulator
MRLLLVEDHADLSAVIADGLRRAGFVVDIAESVLEAREAVALADYALAILDLGLPDGSGLDLMADWRRATRFPVIMLTARGALGDRISGLEGGADDYIVKPVELPELVARCRAVLRRPGNRESGDLAAGAIRLDTTNREATCHGQRLQLGRREIGALEALMRAKGRVVAREVLQNMLYDRETEVTPNAVDAAVSRLRRTLDEAGADVALRTIRGVGWMLKDGGP